MENKIRKPRNYWKIKDNVFEESKKYKNRTEFKKGNNCAYNSARNNCWLDEMTWLGNDEGKNPKGFWKDKENVIKEAKKYKTKEEFQKKNITAFLAAYRYGFMRELTWLIRQKHHKWGYWTYDKIEKEAFKYKTKSDFCKGNPTAYRAALKLNVIDDFFLTNYIDF